MNLPIQAKPVDRSNRAISVQAHAPISGVTPSASPACPICSLLPSPFDAICKAILCT